MTERPTPPGPPDVRHRELGELLELVARAQEQAGGALLLRGEPGMGKSFLLRALAKAAEARGCRVLTTAGALPESAQPFTGLHRLLSPVLQHADVLPATQRTALDVALGRVEGAAPDLFLVALAVLTLLTTDSAEAPVVVLVDDAQWLDRASWDVLGFIARRVESDPLVLVAAARLDAELGARDLPELVLSGLTDEDALALLDRHAPQLAPDVRRRVVDAAAGNPLALVELPGAMDADRRRPEASLLTPPPLTARLEQVFAARARALPAAVQRLLVLAAVDEVGDVADLLRACEASGDEQALGSLDQALGSGLVELVEGRVVFRHPLVRSAIHQQAGEEAVRAAHRALADVLAADADRRIWHRAAGVEGRDDEVADELASAASRAHQRGATPVAAGWLAQAARLTTNADVRAGRLLAAADFAYELGRNDLVTALLAETGAIELSPVQRGQAEWLRQMVGRGTAMEAAGVDALLGYVQEALAAGDFVLALKLLLAAALQCWWHLPGEGPRVAETALAMVPDPQNAFVTAIVALASPVEHRGLVAERLAGVTDEQRATPEVARFLGIAASAIGALDVATSLHARAAEDLRAQGRLVLLAVLRQMQAWAHIDAGELDLAIPAADEARRLSEEAQQPDAFSLLAQAFLAAVGGEAARARKAAELAEAIRRPGVRDLASRAGLVQGVIALSVGDAEAALELLERVVDPADPSFHQRECYAAITYLADAAAACGQPARGREALQVLRAQDGPDAPSILRIGLVYADAVLAEDAIGARHDEALARLGTAGRFVQGRLRLSHGRWLLGRPSVEAARVHLRAALDAFEALGTRPWSDQAVAALREAGEPEPAAATPDAWHRLSPQEMQIAALVADGLTNREIGRRLYLSHRTVASALYRVFPKLGVSSRAELGVLVERRTASSSA